MTATAVSLTMMSLRGDLLHKSTAATGIMTAAAIDDVLSLIGVAMLVPIILVSSAGDGGNTMSVAGMLWIVGKVAIFFGITLFLGLIAFPDRTPKERPANANWHQILDHTMSRVRVKFGARQFLMLHRGELTPLTLLNITVPLSLKWWEPYYLGFKQFRFLGIDLARPELAPVPDDMPEYREMMEEEKRCYMTAPYEVRPCNPGPGWTNPAMGCNPRSAR